MVAFDHPDSSANQLHMFPWKHKNLGKNVSINNLLKLSAAKSLLTESCHNIVRIMYWKYFRIITGECPNIFWVFWVQKGQKFGNFWTNLVEFRVEKGPFQFVTHCYTRAFSD